MALLLATQPALHPINTENILQDKVALVTGADSGIGQATAVTFAQASADVVVCYHTDEPAPSIRGRPSSGQGAGPR